MMAAFSIPPEQRDPSAAAAAAAETASSNLAPVRNIDGSESPRETIVAPKDSNGDSAGGDLNSEANGSRKFYDCNVCGWRFALKGNLSAHLRRHTGEKPYICNICNRKFTQSSLLTVHLRTHTGEKPFGCPDCHRMFSRSGNLATHMRTHTSTKPFECGFCHKRFSQRVNMELHTRTHTGVKPYVCGVCKRKFTSCSNMRRHWRQIHPDHPEPALGTSQLQHGMPEKMLYSDQSLKGNRFKRAEQFDEITREDIIRAAQIEHNRRLQRREEEIRKQSVERDSAFLPPLDGLPGGIDESANSPQHQKRQPRQSNVTSSPPPKRQSQQQWQKSQSDPQPPLAEPEVQPLPQSNSFGVRESAQSQSTGRVRKTAVRSTGTPINSKVVSPGNQLRTFNPLQPYQDRDSRNCNPNNGSGNGIVLARGAAPSHVARFGSVPSTAANLPVNGEHPRTNTSSGEQTSVQSDPLHLQQTGAPPLHPSRKINNDKMNSDKPAGVSSSPAHLAPQVPASSHVNMTQWNQLHANLGHLAQLSQLAPLGAIDPQSSLTKSMPFNAFAAHQLTANPASNLPSGLVFPQIGQMRGQFNQPLISDHLPQAGGPAMQIPGTAHLYPPTPVSATFQAQGPQFAGPFSMEFGGGASLLSSSLGPQLPSLHMPRGDEVDPAIKEGVADAVNHQP